MNSRLSSVINKIEEVKKILNKGNPYHDKLGRFTWSPFGKYKGNPYEAVSIWGDEYKKATNGFDKKLTDEEFSLAEDYMNSPQVGNSCYKNGNYESIRMYFDKDGNPLSESEIAKADELYKEYLKNRYDEKLEREFFDNYTVENNQKVPSPIYNLIKTSVMEKEDFRVTPMELKKRADALVPDDIKKYVQEQLETKWGGIEGVNLERVLPNLSDEQRKAVKVLFGSYSLIASSSDGKVRNIMDYPTDDKSLYEKTKYPNSNVEIQGVTAQYFEKMSDAELKKYAKLVETNGYTRIPSIIDDELNGRKLDRLIEKKGISFNKDIVVTRRVSRSTVMEQEIKRMGYYTQSGFTSTCAANNLPRKSPGGMDFGTNIIKIVIPAGTKVLPIEPIAKKNGQRELYSQHEFLLPSNTKYLGYDQKKGSFKPVSPNDFEKYSPTLGLDKVNKNVDTVYSVIAITDQYQRSR